MDAKGLGEFVRAVRPSRHPYRPGALLSGVTEKT